MGMKATGRSRRATGAPYSRAFTAFGAAIDLTEASLSPATVGGVSPTVGSPATGARHGASGLVVQVPTAGGTLTWKHLFGNYVHGRTSCRPVAAAVLRDRDHVVHRRRRGRGRGLLG